jgi:hypothetical protein
MHQDTATVMPRSSGALPLSPLQANVAEFRPRTLTADDDQERRGRLLLLGKEHSWCTAWRVRSLLSRTNTSSGGNASMERSTTPPLMWRAIRGGGRRRVAPRGRRSRAAARMPSPLAPRAGARPAERASRRHTSDTLSMSKQVYGRATAPSDDHVSSAESQGFKPRSPSSHGALHGGNKPYHGSALPTELRGQKTCKSASRPCPTRGFASRPYCRDPARGARIDTAGAPAGDDARLGERVHRGQV